MGQVSVLVNSPVKTVRLKVKESCIMNHKAKFSSWYLMQCVLAMVTAIWQGPSTQLKWSVAEAVKSIWMDLRPCVLEKSLQLRITWDVCRSFCLLILGTSTMCLNKRRLLPGKQIALSHTEDGKSLWKGMQFPKKENYFPLQPLSPLPPCP